jgi:hypothetical protein
LAPQLLEQTTKEIAMANRRKPSMQMPDPTTLAATALEAGVRAVEMTTALARGFAKSAMTAARTMSSGAAQATDETTKAASEVVRGTAPRAKRSAPRPAARPRRAPRKTQSRRRRAA